MLDTRKEVREEVTFDREHGHESCAEDPSNALLVLAHR